MWVGLIISIIKPTHISKSSNGFSLPLIFTSQIAILTFKAPAKLPASPLLCSLLRIAVLAPSQMYLTLLNSLDVTPDQEEFSIYFLPQRPPYCVKWRSLTWDVHYIHLYIRFVYVCMCFLSWPFVGRFPCLLSKKIQVTQNYEINKFILNFVIKTTKTNVHVQMRAWAADLMGLSKVSKKRFS